MIKLNTSRKLCWSRYFILIHVYTNRISTTDICTVWSITQSKFHLCGRIFFYCTAVTWLRYASNHYNLKMQAEKVTKFINNIYQFINASLLPSVGYIIHVRCIFPAFFVNNDKTSLNIILHWYNDVLNQIQICDQIHVHPFINPSEIVRFISHRNFFL